MARTSKRQTKRDTNITAGGSIHPFAKQLLLALGAAGILLLHFSIPFYQYWFRERILTYYQEFPQQLENIDNIDRRLADRHAYNYLVPKLIRQQTPDSAMIILPTREYIQKNSSPYFYHWHLARWNYYFTGYRKYVESPLADTLQLSGDIYALVCQDQQIILVRITTPEEFQKVMDVYQKDG